MKTQLQTRLDDIRQIYELNTNKNSVCPTVLIKMLGGLRAKTQQLYLTDSISNGELANKKTAGNDLISVFFIKDCKFILILPIYMESCQNYPSIKKGDKSDGRHLPRFLTVK